MSDDTRRGPTDRSLMAMGRAAGGVAHDFNSALMGIASRAALIKAITGQPEIREHADAILKAVRAAGDVVERVRLILYPRSERDFVRVEPAAVIAQAGHAISARAAAAGTAVTIDVHDCPEVAGVPGELLTLVVNLANNAVDAVSEGGGAVTIGCAERAGRVVLSVRDDGPGIPEDVAERVFEPFVSSKGAQGMGLGLTLCRRIAETHGGELRLGPAAGGGTLAEAVLPAAGGEVPKPRRSTSLELESVREVHRVLVVDDDEATLEALEVLLGTAGFDVVVAGGVAAALAAYEATPPTVVVTDLTLGKGTTGLDLLRRLGSLDPSLPVIVTTGDPRADRDALTAAGAQAVMTKPVPPGRLVNRIRELAAARQALRSPRVGDSDGG